MMPLLMRLFQRRGIRIGILILIGCLSSSCLFFLCSHEMLYRDLLSKAPIDGLAWATLLIFGALVALHHPSDTRSISARQFRQISWAAFLGLLAIALFVASDNSAFVWPLEATVASAITACWILAWVNSDAAEIAYSPFIYIGRISFSIYLLHGIPLDGIDVVPWPAAGFLMYSKRWMIIVMIIVASSAMYWLLEKPSIRLGRGLAKMIGSREFSA
jgi:peptidoglycan/LPS O-acetylase OafA/YrhL